MATFGKQSRGKPWHCGDRRGFSLVELMIALVVLSIGILALGQVFVIGQWHTTSSRAETMAVSLSQEIRERIFSEPYDDVDAIFDGVDTDYPDTVTQPCQSWANHVLLQLGANARGMINVLDHTEDVGLVDGMLRVDLVISWPEGGDTRQLPVHFYISKVGL